MRNTSDEIKHVGTITSVDGNVVHVKMLQGSACSGCHAAKLCQSSESKEKEVDVVCDNPEIYEVGQKVLLIGSIRQGLKATLWAYAIPVLLLVAVLFVSVKAGVGETISSLLSLAAITLYFMALWCFRGRFQKQFSFRIREF